MQAPIKVLVLGAGNMGRAIVRLLLDKRGVAITGICEPRAADVGIGDLREACGIGNRPEISMKAALEPLLARNRPDVAIQATCSEVEHAWPDIRRLLEAGVNVISIAEEMTFPFFASPTIAREMDAQARASGVAVVGTGINPGFVLDLLVIALTGACARVDGISARRVNDLSPYGATVLEAQGIGLTPQAFEEGLRSGRVVGHIGFPESIHLIGTALGWRIDRIEQTREPILATARHETGPVVVEPGRVAGCRHRAWAYRDDARVISFDHPQVLNPALEGLETADEIEIHGTPGIRFRGSPEIAGGEGTAALAVNMIPRVLSAAPGLRTMAELPVPSALEADVRQFVHRPGAHGRG